MLPALIHVILTVIVDRKVPSRLWIAPVPSEWLRCPLAPVGYQ